MLKTIFNEKKFEFPWGIEPNTFVQFIDGSKAAYCLDNKKYYWIYLNNKNCNPSPKTNPIIKVLEMSENERNELEYIDIIDDLYQANSRGMYPEITLEVERILVGKSIRREIVFKLNMIDDNLIQADKGIIYRISRKALAYIKDDIEMSDAVGYAIQDNIRKKH